MSRIEYEIQDYITSSHESDLEVNFSVRRYGKVFYIDITPTRFLRSPSMTQKFMTYLEVLKSGEDELNGVELGDIYAWVMSPFEPIFLELAPHINNVDITLQDWFFPEFFHYSLDIVDEKLIPIRLASKLPPRMVSTLRFEDDLLDELESWTSFLDPANIQISNSDENKNPLFKPPKEVFLRKRQVAGFFKRTHGEAAKLELDTYRRIQKAGLSSEHNVCDLHGIVMDDYGFILGLVSTCVNTSNLGPTLACRIDPSDLESPPQATRQRLWNQIKTTVDALHRNGIIWSDVKSENVLVDGSDNAWVIDFGGSYTEGWVSSENAGTIKGDLEGMEKLRRLLLPNA